MVIYKLCNTVTSKRVSRHKYLTEYEWVSCMLCLLHLCPDKPNKEALSAIQRSICVVCLDKAMPQVPDDMYSRGNVLQMMHGGGSQWNSANCWFDKSVQVIWIIVDKLHLYKNGLLFKV